MNGGIGLTPPLRVRELRNDEPGLGIRQLVVRDTLQ